MTQLTANEALGELRALAAAPPSTLRDQRLLGILIGVAQGESQEVLREVIVPYLENHPLWRPSQDGAYGHSVYDRFLKVSGPHHPFMALKTVFKWKSHHQWRALENLPYRQRVRTLHINAKDWTQLPSADLCEQAFPNLHTLVLLGHLGIDSRIDGFKINPPQNLRALSLFRLEILEGLPSIWEDSPLEDLLLSNCEVHEPCDLMSYPHLKSLNIYQSKIPHDIDWSGISANLETLRLGYISEISPALIFEQVWPKLKRLSLRGDSWEADVCTHLCSQLSLPMPALEDLYMNMNSSRESAFILETLKAQYGPQLDIKVN